MTKAEPRSKAETLFLLCFVPLILAFYLIYKYPLLFTRDPASFFLFGKQPAFWYSLAYTSIVSSVSIKLLLKGTNPYSVKKKPEPLSPYLKWKFTSILLAQCIVFFLVPFVILPLSSGADFWDDPVKLPFKSAHVYLWPAFTSIGLALYVFGIITLIVYLFGKRYCSWFCACGNLAESVGTTTWGRRWVRQRTPRAGISGKLEISQRIMMVLAILTGLILLSDLTGLFAFHSAIRKILAVQYFVTDLVFASIIGVLAYPFFGSRIWCRFGCPLAGWMHFLGQKINSRFRVTANEKCKGIGQCSKTCPMGIDVESFAHKDKKPVSGSFGLKETPCIGCGGCIASCPTRALSFINPLQTTKNLIEVKNGA